MTYGRRANKRLETKERIYEAGMQLLLERGFANTTMQDIGERAGVAKSTVFNYFNSKEEILLKFGRDQVAGLKIFAKQLPSDMDTKTKISAILEEDLRGVENSKSYARVQLIESYKIDWIYTLEAQNRVELASVYAKILREGQQKEEIPAKLDCDHVAGLIVAVYFHALYTGIQQNVEIDVKEYLFKSLTIIWEGISNCVN